MSRFLAFKQPPEPRPADEADALLSFEAETDPTPQSQARPSLPERGSGTYQAALAGLLFLAIFALGVASAIYLRGGPSQAMIADAPSVGTATMVSEPSGAAVFADGIEAGVTPIELKLAAGEHSIEMRNGTQSRSFKLTIAAGERLTHHVELPGAFSRPKGRLEVTSDPPGARVTVDNAARGVTPLTIDDIEPGVHRVVISNGATTLQRAVELEAGATASVAVSLAATSQAAGWISFAAPFELHVFDRGELIGTTVAQRLMVPAGRRSIELVSKTFGFRYTANVDVPAGRSTTVKVPVPNGSLSINALPWAEVSVDGQSVGTTPLANLVVPIGSHEVVWLHPQLGERRQTVAVTAQAPARVGVDFTK